MVVSLDELLAEAEQLKRYINDLQDAIDSITESIASIEASKQALQNLNAKDSLISLDKKNFALVRSEGLKADSVLVYLGLNYYAEVKVEEAIKLLDKRKEMLGTSAQSLEDELAKSVDAYNNILALLNEIRQRASGRAGESTG
jgi:prefoldin alpha subunit